MKSLNAPHELGSFPEQLVELAGVEASSHVLDIGCGVGRTLRALARRAESTVGLDSNETFLKQARATVGDAAQSGRVELRHLDIAQDRLPFEDAAFHSVICQNVVECVVDNPALIEECRRVLKPGGVLLMSYHDYGGIMLNSTMPALTQRIIAAYASAQHGWKLAAEGEMGWKLPGLIRSSEFGEAVTDTRLFVDLGFDEDSDARAYCRDAGQAALGAGLQEAEVTQWTAELLDLDRRGVFYFGIPWIYVRAVKAG